RIRSVSLSTSASLKSTADAITLLFPLGTIAAAVSSEGRTRLLSGSISGFFTLTGDGVEVTDDAVYGVPLFLFLSLSFSSIESSFLFDVLPSTSSWSSAAVSSAVGTSSLSPKSKSSNRVHAYDLLASCSPPTRLTGSGEFVDVDAPPYS